MKLLSLLMLSCCSMIVVLAEKTEPNAQALLDRASAQLERLAPYRRIPSADQRTADKQWLLLENIAKDPGMKKLSERQALEIYRILPADLQQDIVNKVGGNRAMIELLANSDYMAFMQDRIKRSGNKRETYDGYESPPSEYNGYAPDSYGEHYGGYPQSSGSDSGSIVQGSTSLISGIAKGIIGGLVSASGSASKGSSSISASSSQSSAQSSASSSGGYNKPMPEYGPVYSYGDKAFDVWDFKKAIISTLMQAVKAISGGVIALKGQLLKGSGYLVTTKGKIITKAGDAVTNLGRSIAKSATHPPPVAAHPVYAYGPPAVGHGETYDGPPPSIEEYPEHSEGYHGNNNYDSASDVDDQAGLLIAKPAKTGDHDHDHDHDHHTVDLEVEKPPSAQPEESYHGPPPQLPNKGIESAVIGNVNSYQHLDHPVESNHGSEHSSLGYDVPVHQHSSKDPVANGYDYPAYPPLPFGTPLNHHGPISIQQSVEYPPIHVQYSLPHAGNLDNFNVDTSNNDLSVYGSLSIDAEPEIKQIKISPPNQAGALQLPKLQDHASIPSLPLYSISHSSLQEPLKVPLLNPYPQSPWQHQGLLQPLQDFDMHSWYRRRSSTQRRRSVSEIAQRMRLNRG